MSTPHGNPLSATAQVSCRICLESFDTNSPIPDQTAPRYRELSQGFIACEECIQHEVVPRLLQAVTYEHHFPSRYSLIGMYYNYRAVADCLPEDFERRWQAMLRMVSTPYSERLYCTCRKWPDGELCSQFLGRKTAVKALVKCTGCGSLDCTCCGGRVFLRRDEDGIIRCLHTCSFLFSESNQLQPGREGYQLCPNKACRMPVQLIKGCNQMRCQNKVCNIVDFCYLCGKELQPGHFDVGQPCPHYGKPGDANAYWDPPTPKFRHLHGMAIAGANEETRLIITAREYEMMRRASSKRHRGFWEAFTNACEHLMPSKEALQQRRERIQKLPGATKIILRAQDQMEEIRKSGLLSAGEERLMNLASEHMATATTAMLELVIVHAYWIDFVRKGPADAIDTASPDRDNTEYDNATIKRSTLEHLDLRLVPPEKDLSKLMVYSVDYDDALSVLDTLPDRFIPEAYDDLFTIGLEVERADSSLFSALYAVDSWFYGGGPGQIR